MTRSWLAWGGLGVFAGSVVVATLGNVAFDGDVWEVVFLMWLAAPFAVVGALVAARQPWQPIGWLLLGCGLSLGLASVCDAAVKRGLEHPGSVPTPGYPGIVSDT